MSDCKAIREEFIAELENTMRNSTDYELKRQHRDIIYVLKRSFCDDEIRTCWNNYIENCKVLTYREMLGYPHSHKGELVVVSGKVIQVHEHRGSTILLVDITKEGEEFSLHSPHIVYINYKFSDNLQIFEDDIIIMYGRLEGRKQYTTVCGYEKIVPLLDIYYAELDNSKNIDILDELHNINGYVRLVLKSGEVIYGKPDCIVHDEDENGEDTIRKIRFELWGGIVAEYFTKEELNSYEECAEQDLPCSLDGYGPLTESMPRRRNKV